MIYNDERDLPEPDFTGIARHWLARFDDYGASHGCWGWLHIVLDDHNLDDGAVQVCIAGAIEAGDHEATYLATFLVNLTPAQRFACGSSHRAPADWPGAGPRAGAGARARIEVGDVRFAYCSECGRARLCVETTYAVSPCADCMEIWTRKIRTLESAR